jgi:Protein of unknown function (DUF2950)
MTSNVLTFAPRLTAAVLFLLCATPPPMAEAKQSTFRSSQEAVDALVTAVRSGKPDDIVAVLGPEGRELVSSGDNVADAAARDRFIKAYDEAHKIEQAADNRAVLVVGADDFPFPIPLVEATGAWRFDTAAGKEEILDRRIGANELAAVEVVRAYVDAQREYAEADRDGNGPQYARHLMSTEGKRDGLYWPTAEGETESPIGPLVGKARAEGYTRHSGAPTPYHGYVFRILTDQGSNAEGGARDYIVGGRMIGGFGLVAAPAQYGNSGVMSFIVNQDGKVFERDLGTDTEDLAASMTNFNPDSSWKLVTGD